MTIRALKSTAFACLVSTTLLAGAQAHADMLVDAWKVSGLGASASSVSKPDGTSTPVDPSVEVLVTVALETVNDQATPGTRLVKNKSVQLPTASSNGVIALDVETSLEKECNPEEGATMQVLAPHNTRAQLVLKSGEYNLLVNGSEIGKVRVNGLTAPLFQASTSYSANIQSQNLAEVNRIFGTLHGLQISGMGTGNVACRASVIDKGTNLAVSYNFVGSTTTYPDGSVLTKPALTGTIELTRMGVKARCEIDQFTGEPSVEYVLSVSTPVNGLDELAITKRGTETITRVDVSSANGAFGSCAQVTR